LPVDIQETLGSQFRSVLWENRVLDVILQVVFIFCGVLGVLGLLSEYHPTTSQEENQ